MPVAAALDAAGLDAQVGRWLILTSSSSRGRGMGGYLRLTPPRPALDKPAESHLWIQMVDNEKYFKS